MPNESVSSENGRCPCDQTLDAMRPKGVLVPKADLKTYRADDQECHAVSAGISLELGACAIYRPRLAACRPPTSSFSVSSFGTNFKQIVQTTANER